LTVYFLQNYEYAGEKQRRQPDILANGPDFRRKWPVFGPPAATKCVFVRTKSDLERTKADFVPPGPASLKGSRRKALLYGRVKFFSAKMVANE
jgi:hypothetical protein